MTRTAPPHPTQVFLSNPQALRLEFRLDDQRLELWWSPKAGNSTDCADRNYSSRDAHLSVFEEIRLPGCDLGAFQTCDYDPYHTILRFERQVLHLAVRPDAPVALVWSESPQLVEFKAGRHDLAPCLGPRAFAVHHQEGGRGFEFAVAAGWGGGEFQHGPVRARESCRFSSIVLGAGQVLALGVGEIGGEALPQAEAAARLSPGEHLAGIDTLLRPHEDSGRIHAPARPEMEALRRKVVRGLHSMIDEGGAYRASLKAIYYLIWVRDSGFSFAYQAAAGWPHKLPELCRLLLDNPTAVSEPGLPQGRMFGQLINRNYGKLEEDGLYYVVWTLFTCWVQTGRLDHCKSEDWDLLEEALAWVEAVTWDPQRGLYGEHFADETPTSGHRDHGWDHAIGKPTPGSGCVRFNGQPVVRNYDLYFNLTMHSTYAMLAAMRGDPRYLERADRVWPALEALLGERQAGVPVYAEQLLEDGKRVLVPHWGQASSCCVWGLTMPNFAPLADWDAVLAATVEAIMAEPEMHWINGICGALAAVDPWVFPEDRLLALHDRVAEETRRPGRYLPMGGAMPEKFAAPEGNLYHDIRPQGFAMGAWLAAWSALGLRRLAHGLALRPTSAFESLESYPWRGSLLDFRFGATGRHLCLEIDGIPVAGTLQVPQGLINPGARHVIRLREGEPGLLWLRSTVQLDAVEEAPDGGRVYRLRAFGLASITLSAQPGPVCIRIEDGSPLSFDQRVGETGLATIHFRHFGQAVLEVRADP